VSARSARVVGARHRCVRGAGIAAALVVLGIGSRAAADEDEAVSARDVYELHLAIDIPVMVAGGGVGLVRALFAEHLSRASCPCDAASVNAIDRGAIGYHSEAADLAANITVYGSMVALPLFDALDLGFGHPLLHDVVVYAEALAVDTAIQNIVNFAVARPRPRTYAGDPEFVYGAEGYLSFYAGHVATAFTAMSAASFTLTRRYRTGIWPWIVTALVGGTVAVQRVVSGHHFPTDVATAAVAGTAIGIAIPWAHARRSRGAISFAPAPSGQGLALVGVF
jgi:membrane-associated phospholipid phosphatase